MSIEEAVANNKIDLTVKNHEPKSHLFVDSIEKGVVLDHIDVGKSLEVVARLGLNPSKDTFVPACHLPSGREGFKDVIKIVDRTLDEKMIKLAAMVSPNITFNIIEDHQVVQKFKALLCENDNCDTRDLDKDVASVFYIDNKGILKCKQCDTAYSKEFFERPRYITSLKKEIQLAPMIKEIRDKLKELVGSHLVSADDYAFLLYMENLKTSDNEFSKGQYKMQIQYGMNKDRRELTEEKVKYLREVEEFVLSIHKCLIKSFFWINYDRDLHCTEKDIMEKMNKRMKTIGLEKSRMNDDAIEFGKGCFLQSVDGNLYQLKDDAEERKNKAIRVYERRYRRNDLVRNMRLRADEANCPKRVKHHSYVISNALRLIDKVASSPIHDDKSK